MDRELKIQYLRLALAMQKITSSDEICDRVIETLDAIEKLGGKFSIKDAVSIEMKMDEKYTKQKLEQ